MNGRTIVGFALLAFGLSLAIVGGYQLANGGGSHSGGSPEATALTEPSTGITATPSLAPTPTPPPTLSPTLSPGTTPAPTAPSPTFGADADAAVRAFVTDLVQAIQTGTIESMGARLNGVVIDRYGVAACEAQLAGNEADATYAVEIVAIGALAPWDYVTDDRSTTIEQAWTVDAKVTALGTTGPRQLHVAPMDGRVSWFTDCGTPLPTP